MSTNNKRDMSTHSNNIKNIQATTTTSLLTLPVIRFCPLMMYTETPNFLIRFQSENHHFTREDRPISISRQQQRHKMLLGCAAGVISLILPW